MEDLMAVEFTENNVNGINVIAISGSIKLGDGSGQLREKLKEAVANGNWLREKWEWPNRIVLDLSKVEVMDSAGLGALVASYAHARSHDAMIKLACLTKTLRDQLAITKLSSVFEVYDDVDTAIKSYTSAPAAASRRP
jgi:anti-sigma B factor antagonist